MHWFSFLIYNAAGGIIWATVFGCLGFFGGRLFHDNFAAVEHLAKTISWVGAVLIVAAFVAVYIFYRVRRKRRAQAKQTPEQTAEVEQEHAQPAAAVGFAESTPVLSKQDQLAAVEEQQPPEATRSPDAREIG
jgi:hypothetical protein